MPMQHTRVCDWGRPVSSACPIHSIVTYLQRLTQACQRRGSPKVSLAVWCLRLGRHMGQTSWISFWDHSAWECGGARINWLTDDGHRCGAQWRQANVKKKGKSALARKWRKQWHTNEKEKRVQRHSKTRSTGGLHRSTHAQGRFD